MGVEIAHRGHPLVSGSSARCVPPAGKLGCEPDLQGGTASLVLQAVLQLPDGLLLLPPGVPLQTLELLEALLQGPEPGRVLLHGVGHGLDADPRPVDERADLRLDVALALRHGYLVLVPGAGALVARRLLILLAHR
eukprot:CAMPEP_0179357784 /NCGR_PEP_ID=MMETSP0797-20121207/78586_1 /TAXON_ID=47934 /ORGANISM="Dinophysis acuminata, Strain DAEP01" /LENGTH=135 /DNA_ID=CAMNT_0021073011 /DNA_START=122 /DNA_END=526 /DNA_ORIENTATION=-